MLELFKPLKKLSDYQNPVIFDEFGIKYSLLKAQATDEHPFIIFYDDNENCYYYLKARGAYYYDELNKKWQLKDIYDGEIIIKTNNINKNQLFYKDSYIDCSQIFKCDANLLQELVDINNIQYKNTKILDINNIKLILKTINRYCNEIPPNLSILEVKLDYETNATYGKSLYISNQKIEKINKSNNYDLKKGFNIYDYLSIPKINNLNSTNRYNNAIEFIKMFQKEYFYDEFINTDYQKKYFEPFFDNSKINDGIDNY